MSPEFLYHRAHNFLMPNFYFLHLYHFEVHLHLNLRPLLTQFVMPVSASKDVQHGLQTWVDYDRPWILRMFITQNKFDPCSFCVKSSIRSPVSSL